MMDRRIPVVLPAYHEQGGSWLEGRWRRWRTVKFPGFQRWSKRTAVFKVALGFGGAIPLAGATFADREYLIDSWETEHGLPENSATAMVQTPEGYLWFGTFNGLVRFDGVKFTVFNPVNTPGLPSAAIVNLHLDASERLWVSTDRGLVVSEPRRWTVFHREPGWTGNYVRTFSENAGVICATSFNGKIFRVQHSRFDKLPDLPGTKGGCLGHVDPTGRIWVAQAAGFFGSWDNGNWLQSDLASAIFPGFVSMTTLRDGSLLVVRASELLRINNGKLVSRLPGEFGGQAWGVHEDRSGTIWISSRGLYRIRPSGDIRYFSSAGGLTYDSVRCTFEDQERNLWVGTSGGGLMRFKPRTFRTYDQQDGLSERNTKAVIEEAPGRIIVGTFRSGLFGWEQDRLSVLPANRRPTNLWVQCLLRDRAGNLWVGSHHSSDLAQNPLNIISPTERRSISAADCGSSSVKALFEDSQGRIWIGGDQTASVFAGGQFHRQNPSGGVNLEDIRCFAEDPRQQAIYAGGREGLFKFAGGQWQEILGAGGQALKEILCLRVETGGDLWVGGAGVGLVRLSKGQWSALTEAHGLPSRDVSCILEDDLGNWWLGSNRGIVRASREDFNLVAAGVLARLPCQVFNLSDGLASVECTMGMQSTSLKDSQGRLWFATLKGVAMVDPRALQLNPHLPTVRLETISYVDRKGRSVAVNLADSAEDKGAGFITPRQVTIPAGGGQLDVRFAALSFTAPEKVKIRYRLTRDGEHFQSAEGTDRFISSPWLPPGSYQLHVTAANNDGIWNEQGARLALLVQPFFWQTTWFQILAALGFGGGITLSVSRLHRNRLQRTEERLKQQQAIAEEKARAAALTQYASDIITLLNQDGRIIFESPSASRVLGYAPGYMLEKDPCTFIHPDDHAKVLETLGNVVRKTSPLIRAEFRFRHAEGNWVPLEALATNLLDQPGIQAILITSRETTERKRAEEKQRELESLLIQAQKMEAVGQLAGGVAHDFNNILTAIMMQLELLQDDHQLSAEARGGLKELEGEAKRAANLTRQLLMFSRRQVLQKQLVELNSVLGNVLKMLRRLIGEHIALEFNCAVGDLWLEADPGMIEQVVMNLVVNARDAMPDGGRVTLSTRTVTLDASAPQRNAEAYQGQFVCLVVSDTGTGMDEFTVKRIFEPFFTTKEAGKGTGLGLATVYGIAKQHRGWIEVETAIGRGSTFSVFLPGREHASAIADQTIDVAAVPGRHENLLVVEDESAVRRALVQMLEKLGYWVWEAGSGPEALRQWAEHHGNFDLVITDIVMPGGISGLDLAERLLREKRAPKVILMSGYSPEIAAHGRPNNRNLRFLQKPFAAATLARLVRECLNAG